MFNKYFGGVIWPRSAETLCKRLSDNAAWGTCAFIALTFRCCQRMENLLCIFIHAFNCQRLPVRWHVRAKVQQRRSLVFVLALIILQGAGCTYLSSIYPSILLVNVLECPVGKKLIPSKKKKKHRLLKRRGKRAFSQLLRGKGGGFGSSPFRLAKPTIAPPQWAINAPVSRTRLTLHG